MGGKSGSNMQRGMSSPMQGWQQTGVRQSPYGGAQPQWGGFQNQSYMQPQYGMQPSYQQPQYGGFPMQYGGLLDGLINSYLGNTNPLPNWGQQPQAYASPQPGRRMAPTMPTSANDVMPVETPVAY